MGAAILDRKSWGPLSWIGRRDVIDAKPAPILLLVFYKQLKFRVQLSWVEHGKKCIPSGPDCFSLLIFFLLCCYKYFVSLHRSTVGWSVVDARDIF